MSIYKWIGNFLIFINLVITAPVQSDELVINKALGRNILAADILTLVLNKVDPQSTIRQLSDEVPEQRLIEELKLGNVDVLWSGASAHLDEELLTVRIPLFKGLLGHRIFIIKKENQALFDSVKTLDQLKQLMAGQGTLWGDTRVLKDAQIPTVATLKYNNLFYMLEGGRFDYFPRAVHEPWDEVDSRPELNLAVEKNILLLYPFAMYLYVKKDNQALHDKLYKGFEMAIADGSFDELFFNNEVIKTALQKADLKNRNVIRIGNPTMHPDTPLNRSEFWLDITNL